MDIFAGSLPFKLTEDDLKKLFEPFGQVNSAKIIIDKITRQAKGFGFIEMPNDSEAEAAIEALNGSEIMGRTIVVNKSDKDRKDAPKNTERKFNNNNTSRNNNSDSSYNNNREDSSSSSNNNRNFGPNKVKGGGYSNNKGGNKGGYNNKNKGFTRGNKRDNYGDENNY